MRHALRLRFLSCSAALLLLSCGLAASGQTTVSPFSKVVVFGDSLSDTGNVAHLAQSAVGERYPGPLFNYTDGRFTDGSDTTPAAKAYFGVWHEQLAKMFPGLTAAKNSLDGGLNYAYGDATTQDGTSVVSQAGHSITVENMGQQVTDYLTGPGATADPKALYILWGGGDDLFGDATPANLIAAPARLAALAKRLADAGAVNIIVPNLPPLGSTPGYLNQPAIAAELNTATAIYNAALATDLASLQAGLVSAGLHVRIFPLDVDTLFAVLVSTPSSHGFADVGDPAQGVVAANPDTYLFWDDVHPTTAGHFSIATAAYAAMVPTVELANTADVPGFASYEATFTAIVDPLPLSPTPTGTITFEDTATSPATILGKVTLDDNGGGALTVNLVPGTYQIVAVYGGDAGYLPGSSVPYMVHFIPPSTTTLTLSASNVPVHTSVTATVTVSGAYGVPTGTVGIEDNGVSFGTATLDSTGKAAFTSAAFSVGTHSLQATYYPAGDYSQTESAVETLTVTPAAVAFSASPASLTIQHGGSGTASITATPSGDFTGSATFACGTLPMDASCTFSPATLTFAGDNAVQTSTLTIATTLAKSAMLEPLPANPPRGGVMLATLVLMPWLGLAGAALLPPSRRRKGLMMLVLAASSLAALGGLTACGSSPKTTAPGTYNVQVVITAGSSSTTLTLPVTVQ